MGVLVIVPCGRSKIWDGDPRRRGVRAECAYTSSAFSLHRRYACATGDAWLILSAKYGFIDPGFVIPGPYDVTFLDPSTRPVILKVLRSQVRERRLHEYDRVVVLGGPLYRKAARQAFPKSHRDRLSYPFAGLNLFDTAKAITAALTSRRPTIEDFL